MALYFMVLLTLLKLAVCLPDPNVKVAIDVDVDVDDKGCGGGGCNKKNEETPTLAGGENILRTCRFAGMGHPDKYVLKAACLELQCHDGTWNYTDTFNPECGTCTFGGEPYIYTFDPLTNKVYYVYDGVGEYSMTQPEFNIHPLYGVRANFTDNSGQCYATTCVVSATYYEPGITVEIIMTGSSLKGNDPIDVYVNKQLRKIGSSVHGFLGTDGALLVLRHMNIGSGNNGNCISVIGTKGLTMAFCKRVNNYPWVYIWAMPFLQMSSLQPDPAPLYGLCNHWTDGSNQPCFTARNETCVPDWSVGGSQFEIKPDLAQSWTWHD